MSYRIPRRIRVQEGITKLMKYSQYNLNTLKFYKRDAKTSRNSSANFSDNGLDDYWDSRRNDYNSKINQQLNEMMKKYTKRIKDKLKNIDSQVIPTSNQNFTFF